MINLPLNLLTCKDKTPSQVPSLKNSHVASESTFIIQINLIKMAKVQLR